jgi:hypothetical protein
MELDVRNSRQEKAPGTRLHISADHDAEEFADYMASEARPDNPSDRMEPRGPA